MDTAASIHNQQLNQVLNTHRLFAMNALGGPSLWSTEMAKLAAAGARIDYKAMLDSIQQQQTVKDKPRALPYDFKLTPTLPIQPSPFFLTADSHCEQGEAVLEGEKIPCFEIGGEKRLCLPQILKTVLAEFNLNVINQACDELFIYCSRCNPEQLEMFKRSGNIPSTASSCGLITLTDAERLCTTLLHSTSAAEKPCQASGERSRRIINEACVPVYHECFGSGRGYLISECYNSPDDKCVECADCSKRFSVQQFIGHSHRNQENRICHWGFDRKKWRCYIMFDSDIIGDEAESIRLETAFNSILDRFSKSTAVSHTKRKATEDLAQDLSTRASSTPKSQRLSRESQSSLESSNSLSVAPIAVSSAAAVGNPWLRSPPLTFPPGFNWPAAPQLLTREVLANFKPRLPTQRSCPPLLVNPENVVPSSETSRYEKNFVPNVSLQTAEDQDQKTEVKIEKSSVLSPSSSAASSPQHSRSSHDGLHTNQLFVLDSLARMESQFLKVLTSSTIDISERETIEQKFMSYSDAVRSYVVSDNP